MNLDIKAILLKIFNLIWNLVMDMLGQKEEEETTAPETTA